MGDENSLQGQTRAHRHTAVSSDGGYLQTNTTGMTNLSLGSILKGDASEIQTELVKGSSGDVLTSGVTDISWVSPSGGSGYEVLYDSGVLGSSAPLSTGTFSAPDKFIKILFYGASVASTTQGLTCNNSNGAVQYAFQSQRDFTTLVQFNNEKSMFVFSGVSTNNPLFFEMNLYNSDNSDDKLMQVNTVSNVTTGNTFPVSYPVYGKWYGGATITRFDMVSANLGTQIDFQAGSRLLVLAIG